MLGEQNRRGSGERDVSVLKGHYFGLDHMDSKVKVFNCRLADDHDPSGVNMDQRETNLKFLLLTMTNFQATRLVCSKHKKGIFLLAI
uniref:Uncharacterized protein n=1 Tax=Tanacetum cinerariifolium TaxID=118510 RepID=A0A6L2LS01_TANCI|nr:hypothetical protein [Tanacetum cinerariifolium]